jgi:DNA-binding MarR family transcriptional regulator
MDTTNLPLDAETKAAESPDLHKADLRLWLRLLTCSNLIEATVRRRLAERFSVTLPRFDFMAQLERAPEGLTLGETSRRMMVTNGNVTSLAERLRREGLIAKRTDPADRRASYVSLTPAGRKAFQRMAAAHAGWVVELFEGLEPQEVDQLMALLGRLKASVLAAGAGQGEER